MGYDDDVERSGFDRPVTPGAEVSLPGSIWLHRNDVDILHHSA